MLLAPFEAIDARFTIFKFSGDRVVGANGVRYERGDDLGVGIGVCGLRLTTLRYRGLSLVFRNLRLSPVLQEGLDRLRAVCI